MVTGDKAGGSLMMWAWKECVHLLGGTRFIQCLNFMELPSWLPIGKFSYSLNCVTSIVQIKALLTSLSCKGQGLHWLPKIASLDPSFGRLETRPPNQLCSTAALDPNQGRRKNPWWDCQIVIPAGMKRVREISYLKIYELYSNCMRISSSQLVMWSSRHWFTWAP